MRGIVRYKFSTTPNTYSNLFRFPPSLSALGTHFRCLGEMCRSFRRSRVCQGSVEGCSRLYRLYFDVQESSVSHQWVMSEWSLNVFNVWHGLSALSFRSWETWPLQGSSATSCSIDYHRRVLCRVAIGLVTSWQAGPFWPFWPFCMSGEIWVWAWWLLVPCK